MKKKTTSVKVTPSNELPSLVRTINSVDVSLNIYDSDNNDVDEGELTEANILYVVAEVERQLRERVKTNA